MPREDVSHEREVTAVAEPTPRGPESLGKVTKKKTQPTPTNTDWIRTMEVVLVFFHSEAAACVYDLFKERGSWKMLNWIISVVV